MCCAGQPRTEYLYFLPHAKSLTAPSPSTSPLQSNKTRLTFGSRLLLAPAFSQVHFSPCPSRPPSLLFSWVSLLGLTIGFPVPQSRARPGHDCSIFSPRLRHRRPRQFQDPMLPTFQSKSHRLGCCRLLSLLLSLPSPSVFCQLPKVAVLVKKNAAFPELQSCQ